MNEVLPFLVVLGALAAVTALTSRTWNWSEARWVWLGLLAQVGGVIAHIAMVLNIYGGDFVLYWRAAGDISTLLSRDLGAYGPEALAALFQVQDTRLPLPIRGGSTGTMEVAAGIVRFLTGGEAFYATSLVFGGVSFLGRLCLYRALRDEFAEHLHTRLLLALMLIPSVVYWSGGLMKEACAIGGLGFQLFGVLRLGHRKHLSSLWGVPVGFLLIAGFKPYLLLPVVIGSAAWWYSKYSLRRHELITIRPVALVAISGLCVVGVSGLGQLFPQFAIENLGERIGALQSVGQVVRGGSTYAMGDFSSGSLVDHLIYSPLALIAVLFRPFIFEVHNIPMLMAAVEVGLLVCLMVLAVSRRRGSIVRVVRSSPILVLAIVVLLLGGLGVGFGTTNLGALARYRSPLMPLYAIILLMLAAPARSSAKSPAPASPAPTKPSRAAQKLTSVSVVRRLPND